MSYAPGSSSGYERAAEWQVLFNSDTADAGAVTTDIWSEALFLSTWYKAPTVASGGRTLYAPSTYRGWLEILPLFTDGTAASPKAAAQMFGFAWCDADKADNVAATYRLNPSTKGGPAMGAARSLSRRLSGSPSTIDLDLVASAETMYATVSGARIYPTTSAGTQYYIGESVIFETRGDFAWTPYISNIAAGTLVLLGRIY